MMVTLHPHLLLEVLETEVVELQWIPVVVEEVGMAVVLLTTLFLQVLAVLAISAASIMEVLLRVMLRRRNPAVVRRQAIAVTAMLV